MYIFVERLKSMFLKFNIPISKKEKSKKVEITRKYLTPSKKKINPLCKDILESPHTLIAGTTGSGKSVLLNSILSAFMTNYGVDNRLYLIDPKRVELSIYKDLPHVEKYTSDTHQALAILDEVIDRIESRYQIMEDAHIRQWNGSHIYIIIDELADIMISPDSKAFKLKLQKILQIARACNIHIIAATQAPNRTIIPANLILNFTNRVALRCLSSIESRQIVGVKGAELLPQYGKGLYQSPKSGITSVDIPYTSESDVEQQIYNWCYGCMVVNN